MRVTNPVSLPPFYCMSDIPVPLESTQHFFISHMIGPNYLLNPSPAPHFKTFQVLLIYFLKCPSFGTTRSYAPM